MWCFTQIYKPPGDRMVLMTAQQWQFALLGAYEALDAPSEAVAPQSHPDDIAQLPVATVRGPLAASASSAGLGVSAQSKQSKSRSSSRRAARIDVNVRFGVHAGFQPYTRYDITRWGTIYVTRAVAEVDMELAAAVVWEAASFLFRLQLIELDRALASSLYIGHSGRSAVNRERAVMDVWGGRGIRPVWEMDVGCDPVTSCDWKIRLPCVKAMASLTDGWRGGPHLLWQDAFGQNQAAYEMFEASVFRLYALEYHALFGTCPVLPLSMPSVTRFVAYA